MEWKNSGLEKATITAKKSGECKFENPYDKKLRLVDSNGKDVPYEELDGICTFNAEANKTYTVKEDKIPFLNLRAKRSADGKKVELSWDAQPGVKYDVKREEVGY